MELLIESEGSVVGVEVKSTDRPRPRDWANLVEFRDRHGDAVKGCILLRAGERTEWLSDRVLGTPWWRVL